MTNRADSSDAGCWIGGWWGQYGPDVLVTIAQSNGFTGTDERDQLLFAYCQARVDTVGSRDDGPVNEALAALMPLFSDEEREREEWQIREEVRQLADDAEAWMNEHVAPEGYSFEWVDGEFVLWSDDEHEDEGY